MWENIVLLVLAVALIGYAAWALPWGHRKMKRHARAIKAHRG